MNSEEKKTEKKVTKETVKRGKTVGKNISAAKPKAQVQYEKATKEEVLLPEGYVKLDDSHLNSLSKIQKKGVEVTQLSTKIGQLTLELEMLKSQALSVNVKNQSEFNDWLQEVAEEYGNFELTEYQGYIKLKQ